MGVEVEYALRYETDPGEPHPDNFALYRRLRDVIGRHVPMRRAGGLASQAQERVFLANGASLYYEMQPGAMRGGRVEAGTPECSGPTELLGYVRAADSLLEEAAHEVAEHLPGELGLLRNGRDAFEHVYGPQENYETDLAGGLSLWLWRTAMVPAVAYVFVASIVHWSLIFAVMAVGFPLFFLAMVLVADPEADSERWVAELTSRGAQIESALVVVLFGAVIVWTAGWLRLLAWREHRRYGSAFLATRMVVTGAGSLRPDGHFVLSEKADQIVREMRWGVSPGDRGLLEIGHLLKALLSPILARPHRTLTLFRRRQRLQLGMADANMCDTAAWLAYGTTGLVLDLVEAGQARGLPEVDDAVEVAKQVSSQGLSASVRLSDGRERTPLQIQRSYLERAEGWLESLPAASVEAWDVVRTWRRCLDLLETDPDALVGTLDWVSKRALIEQAGEDLTHDARKKIDLRYHELGGYHAWLREAGVAAELVGPDALARARQHPPRSSPAEARGRWIRESDPASEVDIDWDEVRIGGRYSGRVIRFDPRRKRGAPDE